MGASCSEALRWVERLMLLLLLHFAALTHCPCLLNGVVLHLQSPGAELLSGAQPSVLLLPVLSSDAMSSAGAGWDPGPCACVVC